MSAAFGGAIRPRKVILQPPSQSSQVSLFLLGDPEKDLPGLRPSAFLGHPQIEVESLGLDHHRHVDYTGNRLQKALIPRQEFLTVDPPFHDHSLRRLSLSLHLKAELHQTLHVGCLSPDEVTEEFDQFSVRGPISHFLVESLQALFHLVSHGEHLFGRFVAADKVEVELARPLSRSTLPGLDSTHQVEHPGKALVRQKLGRHATPAPRGTVHESRLAGIKPSRGVGESWQRDQGGAGKVGSLVLERLSDIQDRVTPLLVLGNKAAGLLGKKGRNTDGRLIVLHS